MYDRTASTVALARTLLMGLDVSRETTQVQTASLKLILETLIEVGGGLSSPVPHAKGPSRQSLAEGKQRTIAESLASFSDAEEQRGAR